jgi:cation diffusion facilitator CzcD-associated flavoprotein CzcO
MRRVLIVGAGFGGIGAAIELRRHGFSDITVLERGPGIGGTWLYNGYPGAACDVPSHLYSFSFAKRRDWSRLCSPRDEILAYLRQVAGEHGIDALVTANTEVASAAWDGAWTVTTTDGRTYEADALIVATGQLHRPAAPRIPGDFQGHSFHSAQWDHGYDLKGKRVAVLGTGASAVQFVPYVARQAHTLTVFQRTGNWFMPRRNRPYPAWARAAIVHLPGVQAFRRQFIFWYGEALTAMIRHPKTLGRIGHARSSAFMRYQLRGHPELRSKLWPDYTFGCKRVLFSSHFLPALARENVELVTDAITHLTPTSVVTDNGEHEVDCIIYGTGFKTTDFMLPMRIEARGVTLEDAWRDGAHAHLGITVPGFPSLFLMYGPNTNTSGGSIVFYEEAQAAYIRQALQLAGSHAIEVKAAVERRSDEAVQRHFTGTAWTHCDSWYRDDSGRIVTNWPGYMHEYAERTRTLDPADYTLIGR